MKITQADLQTASAAMSYKRIQREENFSMEFHDTTASRPSSLVNLSDEALSASAADAGNNDDNVDTTDPRLQLLISVVEMLTGRKIKIFDASELNGKPGSATTDATSAAAEEPAAQERDPGFSVHYDAREVREEAEATQFSARGKIVTSDGRSFDFALDLSMARYEREETRVSFDAGKPPPKDPLVLNLSTDRVRLSSDTFTFDLDADGTMEKVSKLASGSVFLALDRNGNGKIDDGSELFGPQSGDGFSELAALDEDHNGWIDESDSAFQKLQVWRPDEGLASLTQAGVGAISLDRRATPYTLKDSNQQDAGAIRNTGVFLAGDGTAGTVQQIDLVV